ncbi:MAG: hypothetical protein WD069_14955, partial [Planctomycetales bacterium]
GRRWKASATAPPGWGNSTLESNSRRITIRRPSVVDTLRIGGVIDMIARRTTRVLLAAVLIVSALIVWVGPSIGLDPPFGVLLASLLAMMGISLFFAFDTTRHR